ncbi:MAG: amidohydrolase family protein [Rubrivivax sp.]
MNPRNTGAGLEGACDCHVHIYTPGYPLAPSATFVPPPATVDAYRAVQRVLGLERAVLVQPTGFGFDNRCLIDALAAMGAAARGVATLPASVDDATLQRLHSAGVRGVRCMMLPGSGGLLDWDDLPALAARIAPLGWHVDLQLDGRELPSRRAMIDALPGRLVIDHIGKFLEPVAVDDVAFVALQRVLDRPCRWVKLAAPYETSKVGPPDYDDVSALARALVVSHAERCLWASNWPHPNRVPRPDDAALLGLLDRWAPDAQARAAILVHNPAALYGFGAAT